MHIANRTYPTQLVAEVTGASVKDLANWADRGLITAKDTGGVGRGKTRAYSWNTLMQVACASAIMELGFKSPHEALTAAARFAHFGHGQSGWAGEPATSDAVRWPGLPYHHMRGVTVFYFAGGEGFVDLHRIWNGEKFSDAYYRREGQLHGARAHVALDVSKIFNEVCRRLNVDFRVALDEAYKGHDEATAWRRPGEAANG